MRGRKRHLKKAAKRKELQAAKKSSCKSCGCKKNVSPAKKPAVVPKAAASTSSDTKFSFYGKSKVCHAVTVDAAGVVTALCGDMWTPGDEKAAPTIIDAITDDRRLCKKCEKKQ